METATEFGPEVGLQRFWTRRLTANIHEEDVAELLQDRDVFPSAQVEVDDEAVSKSRPASPPCFPCDHEFLPEIEEKAAKAVIPCECRCEDRFVELNAAELGDIPARYIVPALRSHEFPVVGVFVDPRVIPGFKYRIRPIQENGRKEGWLFRGRALELQSIGRGYSRRITFKADTGNLNDNPYYFWSDSRPQGFAFELEVVSPSEKFTVFDANHVAVGTLEIVQNQVPQEEIGHRVLKDEGGVEKTVRIRAICKVEWFEEQDTDLIVPMSGVAICVKGQVRRIIGVTVGSHPRRGFTLTPGINSRLRSVLVRGDSISDVPTKYTITGLEPYELPVIGTFVDARVLPGFHYKVRPAGRRHLFGGRALRLDSVGLGYGKRLSFSPDAGQLNSPYNYFWSDSHPDGVGLEPSAVRAGMTFAIYTEEQKLGEAHVFRADAPQVEESQDLVESAEGVKILKRIHVDVKCHVALDIAGVGGKSPEPHDMRVSGTAVLSKTKTQREASVLRIENIGLDSQLNVLFFTQSNELIFYPL